MTDALLSVLAAVLLAGAGLALLSALTLVPWAVAVGLAERRGLGTLRWGAAGAACSLLGTAVAVTSLPRPVPVLLGVAAAWAVPAALRVRGAAPGRLVGARGRHE